MTTTDLLIKAFENEDFCDVAIKLGDGNIVQAHAVVLKLHSIWFQTRLGGNWANSGPVLCDNHTAQTMKDVIRFLYTSNIQITVQNVEELYTIADFYSFQSLSELCIDFLNRNIGLSHVLDILMMSDKYSLFELKDKCLCFIDSHIETLLLSGVESFYLLPMNVLINVLQRDSLCIHEELLFDNLLLWMEGVDDAARQEAWNQIVPHLRLTSMSYDYFLEKVANKNIVDDAVSLNIMRFLTSLPSTCDEHTEPRRCISDEDIIVLRFRSISFQSTWVVDNSIDGDRIAFSINQNINLRGVLLYGNTDVSFLVSVALYNAHYDMLEKAKIRFECKEEKTFPVLFPKHVALLSDHRYTIVVNMTGGTTFSGDIPTARVNQTLKNGLKLKSIFHDVIYVGSTTLGKGQVKGLILRQ